MRLLLLACACLAARRASSAVFNTSVFLNPLEDLNVGTGALGYATLSLDTGANTISVVATMLVALSGTIAAAHFHTGLIGTSGPVVVPLNHSNTSVVAGSYSVTPAVAAAFLNGSGAWARRRRPPRRALGGHKMRRRRAARR